MPLVAGSHTVRLLRPWPDSLESLTDLSSGSRSLLSGDVSYLRSSLFDACLDGGNLPFVGSARPHAFALILVDVLFVRLDPRPVVARVSTSRPPPVYKVPPGRETVLPRVARLVVGRARLAAGSAGDELEESELPGVRDRGSARVDRELGMPEWAGDVDAGSDWNWRSRELLGPRDAHERETLADYAFFF